MWERLLLLVQEKGIGLGMAFLDGTTIRAHQKAAGATKKGDPDASATCVKLLAALVAAIGALRRSGPDQEPTALPSAGAPRLASSRTQCDAPSP